MHLSLSQDPLWQRTINERAPCHLIDLLHLEVRLDGRQMDSEASSYRHRMTHSRKKAVEKRPVGGVISFPLKALHMLSLGISMESPSQWSVHIHKLFMLV